MDTALVYTPTGIVNFNSWCTGSTALSRPSTGVSPFFALFGRDPVGLAELDWPDLERLDTDGDTFVSSLAGEIRKIWTEIKEASDASKRAAAVLANRNQPKVTKPLQPGDYVFVEYGDDKHSKRLGKAGLPRRRRFKVLKYNPERGYVRIDTDGLRLLDKVSLNKVSRAPRHYSVQDFSTPITTAERKGENDLELPPEWRKEIRHGKTRDYVVYVGPGGRGVANSILQAWREHGGDAAFMPQPRVSSVKNALTYPLPVARPQLTTEQLLTVKPSELTRAFVDSLLAELDAALSAGQSTTKTWARWKIAVTVPKQQPQLLQQSSHLLDQLRQVISELKVAGTEATRHVQGWKISFKPRVSDPTQGDWYATSPEPGAIVYRSMNKLREALIGVGPAPTWTIRSPDGRKFTNRDDLLALAPATDTLSGAPSTHQPVVLGVPAKYPNIGQRVQVYWTADRKHYTATVLDQRLSSRGLPEHYVRYDVDGEHHWHDLQADAWRPLPQADAVAMVALQHAVRTTALRNVQRDHRHDSRVASNDHLRIRTR